MPKKTTPEDPRGLIHEAYRIEGIGEAECRSIYLDWAVSMPVGTDMMAATARLLDGPGAAAPDHPMTAVLREGGERDAPSPVRRGGRRGRG